MFLFIYYGDLSETRHFITFPRGVIAFNFNYFRRHQPAPCIFLHFLLLSWRAVRSTQSVRASNNITEDDLGAAVGGEMVKRDEARKTICDEPASRGPVRRASLVPFTRSDTPISC